MKNLPGKLAGITGITLVLLVVISLGLTACNEPRCVIAGESNKGGGSRLGTKNDGLTGADKAQKEVEEKEKALAEARAKLAKIEREATRKLAEEQARAKKQKQIEARAKKAADSNKKVVVTAPDPVATPLDPPSASQPKPATPKVVETKKAPVTKATPPAPPKPLAKVAPLSAEQIGYCAKTNQLVQWYDYSVRWVSTNDLGQPDGIYLLDEPSGTKRMFHLSSTNLIVGKIYRWDGSKFRQLTVK